jgi:hypothetical protein
MFRSIKSFEQDPLETTHGQVVRMCCYQGVNELPQWLYTQKKKVSIAVGKVISTVDLVNGYIASLHHLAPLMRCCTGYDTCIDAPFGIESLGDECSGGMPEPSGERDK